ncbi:FAD/NAD(P)-binding protein [Streptomyces stackebrandtii]|uniref:FAD/NAD(P)-binding protein n=1 Tax=Streptomyces stackebrandtii TaxID=3051177 RepID=UPI0028DC314B|nr:FAD/NAD(P)-binding protein [Streptomyces sp. DSM 40976]
MLFPARIGIIGGGASAVCLLDTLSQREEIPESVTVFDPSPHLWRGRAYQPDAATLRVNAPPEDMTVRAGDPEHFTRWLEARAVVLGTRTDHVDARSGIAFPPRALYGDYLEQCARSALNRLAARGSRIRLVRSAVVDVAREDGSLVAYTADRTPHALDHAVLCVGTGEPADPHGLTGTPGFIADPYPVVRRLAGIGEQDRVVVVGSGLTAVDVVLQLTAAGHTGEIVMASRRGVLPSVRQRPVERELRYFTAARFRAVAARGGRLTLDEVVSLMGAELADAGSGLDSVAEEIASCGVEDPVARLRRQYDLVDGADPGLRLLQRAVPDTGPDVWPLLPEHERTRLLRDHYRTVMSLCCPMPPASAATLLDRAGRGLLRIVRGVERLTARPDGGFRLVGDSGVEDADVVVNAVSPGSARVPRGASALVDALVRRGLAVRHPRGGVHVARSTSGLLADGETDRRIHVLGDLASGSLFFTFGVPSLVDRAVDIADAVHAEAARTPVASANGVRAL